MTSSRPGSLLQRFVDAQDEPYWGRLRITVFERAIRELKAGMKRDHWIWFVFPQLRGLGLSTESKKFSLRNPAEAVSYLKHDELRRRYLLALRTVEAHLGRIDLDDLFSSRLDAVKFISSVTLFRWTSEAVVTQMDGAAVSDLTRLEEIKEIHRICEYVLEIARIEGLKPCGFTQSTLELYHM